MMMVERENRVKGSVKTSSATQVGRWARVDCAPTNCTRVTRDDISYVSFGRNLSDAFGTATHFIISVPPAVSL